jgi:hypothetical protein
MFLKLLTGSRFFFHFSHCKGDQQLNRAEPGEACLRTRLYDPLFTPHKQLGDWGLGIGLYFSTLRALCILTFLAGVLNTQNFIYFSSPDYDARGQVDYLKSSPLLMGSAICNDMTWVPCPDCEEYAGNPENFAKQRIGIGLPVNTTTMTTTTAVNKTYFALRNNCEGPTVEQGMVNYATLLFLIVGTFFLVVYLRKMAVAFDEDEQTAQVRFIYAAHTNPPSWSDPVVVFSLLDNVDQLTCCGPQLPCNVAIVIFGFAA